MPKRVTNPAASDPGQRHPLSGLGSATAQQVTGSCLVGIITLPFVFLYVCFVVQPAVDCFHSGRSFFLSWTFLHSFLLRPGGLLEYAAAFLDALSYANWSGAAVFTALVALVVIGSRWFVLVVAGVPLRATTLILPFLLLLLRQQPSSTASIVACGLVVALFADLVIARVWKNTEPLRLVAGFASGAGLVYAAGIWPGLLFGLLGGVRAVGRGETVLVTLARWAGIACGAALLAVLVSAPVGRALAVPGGALGAAAYLAVPSFGLSMLALRRFLSASGAGFQARQKPWRFKEVMLHWGSVVGMAAVLGGVLWQSRDPQSHARAEIDYYSHLGKDSRVLEAARTLPQLDAATEIRLHLALWHLGRLNEELFAFDNCRLPTVLPGLSAGVDSCRAQSVTLFELGQVGVAEHLAHEALEWEGERPDILLCLARVNELKGRPKAAKVFLHVLSQIPRERQQALHELAKLDAGGSGMEDALLSRVRGRMPATDLPHDDLPAEPLLRQSLHANIQNQMAFEYLMAQYLLSLDLDRLVATLPSLERLGYRAIPRHVEEGVLLWQKLRGKKANLGPLTIRPETEARFKAITEAIDRREHESTEGRRALKAAFGDTFWLYYIMNRGVKNLTSGGQP